MAPTFKHAQTLSTRKHAFVMAGCSGVTSSKKTQCQAMPRTSSLSSPSCLRPPNTIPYTISIQPATSAHCQQSHMREFTISHVMHSFLLTPKDAPKGCYTSEWARHASNETIPLCLRPCPQDHPTCEPKPSSCHPRPCFAGEPRVTRRLTGGQQTCMPRQTRA